MQFNEKPVIAVIGLGYVGLPLAVEFGKQYQVIGFDIKEDRIRELEEGRDSTLEVPREELKCAHLLRFSSDVEALRMADFYIVSVPTPVNDQNQPDLTPLTKASEMLSPLLEKGNVVVYESTVYPGATEEVCVPLLEKGAGLVYNKDFFVGYSPERINPGDAEHRLPTIVKVTSGSTPEIADYVDEIYASIITAGTHKASSIKVAEAAKVIENTQRDLNIALVNELAIIFNKLRIDTLEVLKAAGTKWNFLTFRPGLVGGHCIGVDPYYLTYKANVVGYHPEVILAGRRLNDNMGHYITSQVVKQMIRKRIHIVGSKVLIMGLTFKENCPDLRNTRVTDIVNEFKEYGAQVEVCDPWVNTEEAELEYGIPVLSAPSANSYDAVVVAVAHEEFVNMGAKKIRSFGKASCVVYDIKGVFEAEQVDCRL